MGDQNLVNRIPDLVLEKKARDKIDYKNKDIAKAIGLSQNMVSLFLRNKVNIGATRFETILAWSDWLDVDPRDLVQRQE